HPAAGAAVTRNVMHRSRVAEGQFAPASATAKQARQQGVAVLGGTVMPAAGNVAADHLADRFSLFPADISLMGVWHQRQPLAASLAADLHLNTRPIIARRDSRLTIGIGAAVSRACRALPSSRTLSKTRPMVSCTRRSGSFS